MDLFGKFTELTWFTIAMLAVALIAGIAALLKKDRAKVILIGAGALEALLIGAVLVYFKTLKGASGTAFSDIGLSAGVYALCVIALLAAMLLVVYFSGKKQTWTARDIAYAAMVVAMSFILSYIRLFTMPQGGSITPASLLPIMLYTVAFGPARGLVIGFAYGLLQLFQGAYVVHPAQMLLDYPMAFGALALGGIVKYIPMPNIAKLPAAIALGYFGRFVMAVLSGVIFFSAYAEGNVWIYSIGYNAAYLAPDMAACVVVSLIPGFYRIVENMKKR
jgi:thiamine transporter